MNESDFLQGENFKVSEGKSGSFFCFSPDRKFILKTLFPQEAKLLNKIIHNMNEVFIQFFVLLINTLCQYISKEKTTFISKFYGFHGIQIPHGEVIYMVVMGNVFNTQLQIHEIYDLKVRNKVEI